MDYDDLVAKNSMLGSAVVIVLDETVDKVQACLNIARFYSHESCGQCTPCREGTGWLYKILTNIIYGKATNNDLEQLDRIASQIEGHCICALGDAAAMPVRSFIKNFWSEFEYYVDKKESMVS